MSLPEVRLKANVAMGFCATGFSLQDVATFFDRSRSGVYYWKKKVIGQVSPTPHGGVRSWKFNVDDRACIEQAIFDFVKDNNGLAQRKEIVAHLKSLGFQVSLMFISRVFRKWDWGYKVPSRVNIQKFTEQNLEYYFNFYSWIRTQRIGSLKFIDESHFAAQSAFIFYIIS